MTERSKAVRLATRVREDARQKVKAGLARAGWRLSRLDEEGRRYVLASHDSSVPLPDGAAAELTPDNAELLALRRAYDDLDLPSASHSQWRDGFLRRQVNMAWFRGDNAYVWQLRQLREAARTRMYLALREVETQDRLGLLDRLEEDGLFGAWTFQYSDRPPVSRDLLDSVTEINYLEQMIGLTDRDDLSVLDIGAGYGRLAHRMSAALPNLRRYDCVDGVALSTFLCSYYLRFREAPDTVSVIRLTEYQKIAERYTVAVNIHSFSECPLAAIRWWLDQIAERDIEWLLIVPNHPLRLFSTEADGEHLDFLPDVVARGYELVDHRPVHVDPELREFIPSDDRFFLFRRTFAQGVDPA
jgi:hypothetical protein